MLYDAAAGLGAISQNKLDFYIDAVGVAAPAFGPVNQVRYNCYIRIIAKAYLHLFFQVTTPVSSAFLADLVTPEGDSFPNLGNETQLDDAIDKVMQRPRTQDILDYLLKLAAV
jgi:hypothetical protein